MRGNFHWHKAIALNLTSSLGLSSLCNFHYNLLSRNTLFEHVYSVLYFLKSTLNDIWIRFSLEFTQFQSFRDVVAPNRLADAGINKPRSQTID
jgi:hypothetical protein